MKFTAGDLIQFGYVYHGCDLNHAKAMFLGEEFFYRNDGCVVENYAVLVFGESQRTIIDKGMLKHMRLT